MYVCSFSGGLEADGSAQSHRMTDSLSYALVLLYVFLCSLFTLTVFPSLPPVPSTPFPYLSPFYYLTLPVFCSQPVLKISCVLLLSLLLHPSLSPIFLFPFSNFLFLSLPPVNIQASCVCCPSLSSPFLCTIDYSSVWPLAFSNSDSFSGNQVLYLHCNIVLSAGIWYAYRYD